MMKKAILSLAGVVAAVLIALPMLQSCGIYSFTGTSIQPDVKTQFDFPLGRHRNYVSIGGGSRASKEDLILLYLLKALYSVA